MKIFIEREKKIQETSFNGKVKALLKKLVLNPEIVLVTRQGKLLTEEDTVKDTDEIKIISVISGG